MRFSTRELVLIGVFGALWASVEVGAGGVLHAFQVPFAGGALAAAAMLIALSGRLFVDRPGAILVMGLVTAMLKMLSIGGLVLRPMIGIVAESVIAEAVLLAFRPSRVAFVAAGGAAVLWTLVHPFLTGLLFAGQDVLAVYAILIANGARLLGLDRDALAAILATIIGSHLVVGATAGFLAWEAGRTVRERWQAVERGAP